MNRVLIIGGAGYIGGITTDVLINKGYSVTVYDNLMYESRYLKNCDFIFGDICETDVLVKIHKDFDHIIWLAALVGDGACQQDPRLTYEINVNSLKRFLNKTKRRMIYTSTCSVYGAQHDILDEGSNTNPLSLYASTKLEAEQYVLNSNGLVFRLGTLYGLGDQYSRIRLDLVVNIMTLRAVYENKLTVFGGKQWRPILYVGDVAHYIDEALKSDYNDIYNLKNENVIIMDIAERIKSIFSDIVIEQNDMPFEDLRNYKVDDNKAKLDFKFRPLISLEDEVNRMKQLFSEKRLKDVNDNIYYNTRFVESLINKAKKEKNE